MRMTPGATQHMRATGVHCTFIRWHRQACMLQELVSTLCNRRYTEKSVAYAESHDQAIVGDQTIGETGQTFGVQAHPYTSIYASAHQHLL